MAEENRLFQVEIITPDRVFYTGEGDMIEFTTASGEIGVYKKHIPLTTVLAPGIVKIHKTGEDDVIAAVHSGFAEILPDIVLGPGDNAVRLLVFNDHGLGQLHHGGHELLARRLLIPGRKQGAQKLLIPDRRAPLVLYHPPGQKQHLHEL